MNFVPRVGHIFQVKERIDRASKVAQIGAIVVRDKAVNKVLDGTAKQLKNISKALGIIRKIGGGCATIEKLLNAINTINKAGCAAYALGHAFDDLVRTAGEIGSSAVPPPADVYFE